MLDVNNSQLSFIYGCFPSYVSLYAANLLIKKHKLKPAAIFISTRSVYIKGKKISGLSGLYFVFKNFGLRYTFYQWIIAIVLPLIAIVLGKFKKREGLISFQELAQTYNFQLIYSDDFSNDYRILEFVKKNRTKIFLSLGLDQIIKPQFLEHFETACVNIHPSKLPDFRGVDPIFQFLLSEEPKLGVTLHRIEQGIDQGNIILTESINRSSTKDTHLSFLRQSVQVGCQLFVRFLVEPKCHEISQNILPICFPYKSWPTPCDLLRFSKKRYFLFTDLINALWIEDI